MAENTKPLKNLMAAETLTEDEHTFLCSRHEFQAALAERLKRSRQQRDRQETFSLILLKVDGLEATVEGPGELAQEDLYDDVVACLSKVVRRHDIVTHLKGGRFALLLDRVPDDSTSRLKNAIRDVVAARLPPTDESDPRLRVWVGKAHYPEDGQAATALLNRAKKALVQAKGERTESASAKIDPRPAAPSSAPDALAEELSHSSAAPEKSTEPEDPNVRILVADDERRYRDVVTQVLTDEGYEVDSVDSGEAALLAFAQEPYQLVITDIEMAGMDGIELLQKVKEFHAETQVVVMTDRASLETATTALRCGAYDYIVKPFEEPNAISLVANRAVEKVRLLHEKGALVEQLTRQNEELRKKNHLLRELSVRNELTGLHNHRYFQESLVREVHRCRRYGHSFSVIFMVVDDFRRFTDDHGHGAGEQLLRSLSNILRDCVRRSDVVAHYGNEEFLLLLPETEREVAGKLAEKVRQRVEEHPFAGRAGLPPSTITVSAGVATFPEDADDGPLLMARTNDALSRAKKEGKNRVCLGTGRATQEKSTD